MVEAGMTGAEVQAALGISCDVDLLTFNSSEFLAVAKSCVICV
jgi:hypothetical protein|tara:strand:+ start:2234 stop:2362 length:129 start_codon:yes stop_codon:yes gene_type:complete